MSEHRHRIAIEVSRCERELWRRQYRSRPYLKDASDEDLADRFRTIIQNMTTLTERGQINALPREPMANIGTACTLNSKKRIGCETALLPAY